MAEAQVEAEAAVEADVAAIHSFRMFANAEPHVCACVCVAGHLSFMWRNALPNCVQIAHTDNSFSLRHIKVFWLCCPGKLLRQHVLHLAASVTMTTTTAARKT